MSARAGGRKLPKLLPRILLVGCLAASSLSAQTQGTIERLVGDLKSTDPQVRKTALSELARFGPNDRAAVTGMAAALSDRNQGIRLQASEGLKNLGAAAAPAVDELIAALGSRMMGVSTNAQQALVAIGPQAIPTLITSLEKIPERTRRRTVWVLGYMGDDATPALIEAMKNDQSDVRVAAVRAIIEMGEKGQRRPRVDSCARRPGRGGARVGSSCPCANRQQGSICGAGPEGCAA